MIPKRRPAAVEEVELDDEDILDAEPTTVSGTYAVARPAPPPLPSRPAEDVIIRLKADSVVDAVETRMNDVTMALARLSVGTNVPVLCGAVQWNDLAPNEAWVVSVIMAGFNVQAIIDSSPLPEEDTLTLLGHLVSAHVITVRVP